MGALVLTEQAAAGTPASGDIVLYSKTDGLLYWKDSAGTEYGVAYQATGSTATTFTYDGSGGTSASKTLTWQKIGNVVTLTIPAVTATTGTNSTVLSSNTAFSTTARPVSNQDCVYQTVLNNGGAQAAAGRAIITTGGLVSLYRDGTGTTTFTNSSTCGTGGIVTLIYSTS